MDLIEFEHRVRSYLRYNVTVKTSDLEAALTIVRVVRPNMAGENPYEEAAAMLAERINLSLQRQETHALHSQYSPKPSILLGESDRDTPDNVDTFHCLPLVNPAYADYIDKLRSYRC
jgi:hypothetical protein